MDWISSESLPGLPRESEAFMVLFCLFVCLFFLVFVFVAFFFWKTEGKKNTSTCVQCTKKMVEGFVRSRSQEHNWYYTCNLALQSVHTSLVRSWCFSCSPIPVSVFLFAFNVVIVSSRYIWGLYCCSVLSWTVISGLFGDLSHDRFLWPWTLIMRFLIHLFYRIIL